MVVKIEDQEMDSAIADDPETNLRERLKKESEKITSFSKDMLVNGDSWFLIERRWYDTWKRYVNNDDGSFDAFNKNLDPGPVDNTPLLDTKDKTKLKEKLLEHADYMLLPQAGWDVLVKRYGVVNSNCIIERKVIETGTFAKHTSVEIYPLVLKLKQYDDKDCHIEEKSFSKVISISELEKKAKSILSVPNNKKCKMWDANDEDDMQKLDKNKTIQDCSLLPGQLVVLEVQDDDGAWPYTDALPVPSSLNGPYRNSNSNYQLRNGGGSSSFSSGSSYLTPGLCGLNNLGNTCFMNSALQCLSNVPPLTNHFNSGKYKKELNRNNPLGMGGRLAEEYAQLIQTMWSGQHSSMAPRDFKMSVSQFAPRFSGYQQHDSQELLSFLVDGLHEDLNRISKKPYIEMKEAGDRPMTQVAEESWQNHRKRNDSIVVDTLHGLFRSTVDCPECPRISVTFDPFCFLSLPLPAKRERAVECCFVPLDMDESIMKYKVTVNKNGSLYDLHMALSQVTKKAPDEMVTTNIYNNKFQTFYKITDLMKQVYDKEQLYVFETDTRYTMIPMYMRRASSTSSSYNQQIFGLPLVIPLETDDVISYVEFYRTVYRAIYRHLTNSDLKEKIKNFVESDSDKMEDFVNKQEDGDDDGLFNLFKMKTVNAYGTQEYQTFEEGSNVEIKEKMYLCADWNTNAYKKYVLDQWNTKEKLHESADPLAPKKTPTGLQLQDCMKLFTTKEQLDKDDAWYCSNCKKHQQATKKFDLWMLPPVLVIHLKRFSYTRYYRDKLDTFVNFPLKNLDLSDFVVNPHKDSWPRNKRFYNLIAVSNHYGGLGGGHYTAYAKNYHDGKWHYFDDSSVSPSSEDRVVTKAAYMLIYQRQDLEEWLNKKSPSDTFPYLEPLFSPRATAFNPPRYNLGDQNSDDDDDDEDDVFNNNHEEAMDTAST